MGERDLEYALEALDGAIVGIPAEWTIASAFEELEACGFECVGGPLENHVAYRWLKEQF